MPNGAICNRKYVTHNICNSWFLTQFTAFFIDLRAKWSTDIAYSLFYYHKKCLMNVNFLGATTGHCFLDLANIATLPINIFEITVVLHNFSVNPRNPSKPLIVTELSRRKQLSNLRAFLPTDSRAQKYQGLWKIVSDPSAGSPTDTLLRLLPGSNYCD